MTAALALALGLALGVLIGVLALAAHSWVEAEIRYQTGDQLVDGEAELAIDDEPVAVEVQR